MNQKGYTTSQRRKSHAAGSAFEVFLAAILSILWGSLKRIGRGKWGESVPDLEDQAGICPYIFEATDRAALPVTLEKKLDQCRGYGDRWATARIPVVIIGLRNRRGQCRIGAQKEARIYMDFLEWVEREQAFKDLQEENKRLRGEIDE